MNVDIHVIHAFSIGNTGGNPAGVVFDAEGLSNEMKQFVAKQAGFPETAFVSASAVADYKLDFFTPTKQIPHCGHATIATFTYLKEKGKIKADHSSKETIDGIRSISFRNGQAYMEQRSPQFISLSASETEKFLQAIGLTRNDLIPGLEPMIVNTGNSFAIIPVRDEKTLSALVYEQSSVYELSEKCGLIGFYLYTSPVADLDATTRMFAPYYGISEEAATGMAAGPLACYLYQIAGIKKSNFRIGQGRFMHPASPSLLNVALEILDNSISRLFAGGSAYVSRTFTIDLS